MDDEDRFRPHLGRPRDLGKAGGKRFSAQLRKAAARLSRKRVRSKFSGAQIGRGSAAGRAAAFRAHPFSKFRMRRVVVKVHIARAGQGIGRAAFKAHLKYIQRDGVDRDGEGGELYSRDGDRIDDKEFVARSGEDRHQFRLIVSAEDADQLADLKETTRALMAEMEKDLGARLDWVAVDHHNTGHAHTHIVVRGKDRFGKDLVIAREYLTQGLRRRACDLVTRRLGPRRDLEIAKAQAREVTADRLTGIDRQLCERIRSGVLEVVPAASPHERFERTLALRRLAHLEKLGLAEKAEGGWRLADDWRTALKTLGRRGDKIRELAEASSEDAPGPRAIYEPATSSQKRILGRVVTDGPDDEIRGSRYLIVDGVDGTRWHVSIGERTPGTVPPGGAIVEISAAEARPKAADRIIARIALQENGRFSADLHAAADPASTPAFRQAHVRRLEALRRAGIVARTPDGVFLIPTDYLDRAASHEAARSGGVRLAVRSWIGLGEQIERHAPTWLDDADAPEGSQRGFGKELAAAKRARQEFLRRRGWLGEDGRLDAGRRTHLAEQELNHAARKYEASSAYLPLSEGAIFSGVYERPVDLAQGRFAVVAKSKEFTLVPWRPELERHRGAKIDVRKTAGGIEWTVGRTRSISR